MTIQTEALKLALEALEIGWSPKYVNGVDAREKGMKAITAIKAALEAHKALANHIEDNLAMVAQPAVTESHKQEPVAWLSEGGSFSFEPWQGSTPLYTTSPQRTWVGLTNEEYKNLHLQMGSMYFYQDYGRAIEAKLKAKNERKEKNT